MTIDLSKPFIIKILDFNSWVKIDYECMKREQISKELREQILKADNYKCVYCGSKSQPFEIDHVYPFSKGGATIFKNLACSCIKCNRKKYNNFMEKTFDN